VKAPLTV